MSQGTTPPAGRDTARSIPRGDDGRQAGELLGMALEYAELGWRVLPLHSPDPDHPSGCDCRRRACRSPAKHPRTMHGVRDATTDLDAIRRWWRLWPAANVGIATGGGLVVLDVDPRHGGDRSLAELEAEHGPILAPTVRTGGGGLHLYMAGELRQRAGIRPGLDTRAEGGYVVAPPSLHASGRRYEWIVRGGGVQTATVPPWLRSIVDPPRPVGAPARQQAVADAPASPRYVAAAIEAECMTVAEAPEGARNEALNRAAFALARFVAAGQADGAEVARILEVAALHAGLGEAEIRRTIESAFRARGAAA